MKKRKIIFVTPVSRDNNPGRYFLELSSRLPTSQFEVTAAACPTRLVVWTLFKLFRQKRPDIVHLNGPAAASLGSISARLARVRKIILTAHDSQLTPSGWLGLLGTHHIIATTEQIKSRLSRWPGLSKKITVIRLGLPRAKGKDQSLEKIFVLPETEEAIPYTLLEAGQAGRAVVAAARGGAPEIITNMETGILVRPGDSEEVAKAKRFLTANPKRAAELGRNLRKKVERYFSTKQMVKKTLEVYNGVR